MRVFSNAVAVSLFALKREAIGSSEAERAALNLAEAHQLRHRNAVIMLQDVEKRNPTMCKYLPIKTLTFKMLKRRQSFSF